MLKINKNLGVFSLKTLSEPLQNRVPRVRVLLPLPSKNGLNTAFKPFLLFYFLSENAPYLSGGCLFGVYRRQKLCRFMKSYCPLIVNHQSA